ncbi:hypothetical protein AX16_002006, partial [Volvariella volvacea WC 439]
SGRPGLRRYHPIHLWLADKFRKVWGLDGKGEGIGCWRDLKVKGLWYVLGKLAMSSFHSKHVA